MSPGYNIPEVLVSPGSAIHVVSFVTREWTPALAPPDLSAAPQLLTCKNHALAIKRL